jgi:hypothetical protein
MTLWFHIRALRRRAADLERSVPMRFLPILLLAMVLGCSAIKDRSTVDYDPRLNGTWHLAAGANHSEMLTFSNRYTRICSEGFIGQFVPYRVLERGSNYVVFQTLVGPNYQHRYTFTVDGMSLLVPQSTGGSLRFNKVTEPDHCSCRDKSGTRE